MSPPSVDYVLNLIDQMSEEDRAVLELRLLLRIDSEWASAVAHNQKVAEERGITEGMIDRLIDRRRYRN